MGIIVPLEGGTNGNNSNDRKSINILIKSLGFIKVTKYPLSFILLLI